LEITEGLSVGDQLSLDAYQRGLADFGDAEKEAQAIQSDKKNPGAAVEGTGNPPTAGGTPPG
jgi:hypothetical protein